MKRWKTNGLRRLFCTVLSAALLMSSVTIPVAADYVEDEIASHAEQLAKDNSYTYKANGEIKQGSSGYDLNATTASGGRKLYVIESKTTTGYTGKDGVSSTENNKKLECAVFFLGSDNCVYWTEPFSYFKTAAAFTGKNAGAAGVTDAFSILLPSSCKQVLGVYLHKEGSSGAKAAWGAEWMRVVEYVTITETKLDNGRASHSYKGIYAAGVSELNELDENEWGSHFWAFNKTIGASTAASAIDGVYLIELVTGADGYSIGSGTGGTITVSYKDTAGSSSSKQIDLAAGVTAVIPDTNFTNAAAAANWGSLPSGDWLKLTDRQMTALASGYVGNSFTVANYKSACLSPYSATFFAITLPKNINEVTSIKVALTNRNDSMAVQSIRLIDGSGLSGSYFNGSLSAERVIEYSGTLVAETTAQRTVNAQGSWEWKHKSTTASVNGMDSFAYGTRRIVYGTSTGVGVSIQFADIAGAGIEKLLAKKSIVYNMSDISFGLRDALKSSGGEDAAKALHNLGAFYKEPLKLEVTYKDTFGSTRKVAVPFMTAYLINALHQSGGKLSGGSYATWISGIFQQNETAALTLRLAEYKSLVSVRLTYGGTAISGLASTNSAVLDTANDSIAIENLCVYEKVTSSNFKSAYDKNKLAIALTTSLTPTYSWSAPSGAQGKTLTSGGVIAASLDDDTLKSGAPTARSYPDQYVVSIKTANIESADTYNDVQVSIAYTDKSGMQKSTPAYKMRSLVNAYYGAETGNTVSTAIQVADQYVYHMGLGCTAEFMIELADVESIDSITLSLEAKLGIDSWQVESVSIYKLTSLSQRTGVRYGVVEGAISDSYIYWERGHNSATADRVAYANQNVLFYLNNPSKTIYFTNRSETGEEIKPDLPTKETEYLTTLPTEMTYEDTLKNLGLSIVKCTYRVDVEVSDLDDAGSTNYFYFQLLFENGESAVVLANQQLASDSFRQGCTESFRIKTTQNYGNVKAVRVICDATSSTSDVFDKLNISQISVTLDGSSGVSKTWLVENVGWIDITYVDEGEDQGVDGLEKLTERTVTNAEIVKEFGVSRMATAVDLLFCIKTASTSAGGNMRFGGITDTFEATLVYRDGNGVEQSKNFDLRSAIAEYNDSLDGRWFFRQNHTDRFRLTMTDISAITSLILTRSDSTTNDTWVVESVSVHQVGGLGEVYLSTQAEYYRDPVSSTPLTTSSGAAGTTYSIGKGGMATIPFEENYIDVAEDGSDESVWNATISRVPSSKTESLHVTLFAGEGYTYHEPIPEIQVAVQYNTLYGDELKQSSHTFRLDGALDGERVLYTKSMEVDAMSTFHNLKLKCVSDFTNMPTVSRVIVQRVRDGVILDTYSFDYGNHNLGTETPEQKPTVYQTSEPMHQKVYLQLADDESCTLSAGVRDLAVALRYTSTLDPSERGKTVYQSPYVYLTEKGYTALREGQLIELGFELPFVDSIVGLAVVTDGAPVAFSCGVAENYSGAADAESPERLSAASFADAFTATTLVTNVDAGAEQVVPVELTFTTASEDTAAGAGTSGKASVTIHYLDDDGAARTLEIPSLLRRLSTAPTAGSTATLRVLLPGLDRLKSAVVSVEDSWFIASLVAEQEKASGTETVSVTVNNWARSGAPLTVDLSEFERYNYIQTFTVSALVSSSAMVYGASAGGTMNLSVYAGDTVKLTPAVTCVGSPDTSWTWNLGWWADQVTVNADGSATFRVPSDWKNHSSATISVTSNADQRKTIAITMGVYLVETGIGDFDFQPFDPETGTVPDTPFVPGISDISGPSGLPDFSGLPDAGLSREEAAEIIAGALGGGGAKLPEAAGTLEPVFEGVARFDEK